MEVRRVRNLTVLDTGKSVVHCFDKPIDFKIHHYYSLFICQIVDATSDGVCITLNVVLFFVSRKQ